jgi:hypothetical protein
MNKKSITGKYVGKKQRNSMNFKEDPKNIKENSENY